MYTYHDCSVSHQYLPYSSLMRLASQIDSTAPFVNMSSFEYEYLRGQGRDGQISYLAVAESITEINSQLARNATYDQMMLNVGIATGRIYIAFSTDALYTFECSIYNTSYELDIIVKQDTSTVSATNPSDVAQVLFRKSRKESTTNTTLIYFWFQQLCNSILGFVNDGASEGNIGNTVLGRSDEYQAILARTASTNSSRPSEQHLIPLIEQLSLNLSLSLMSDDGYW
jgi:hypothetical protein